MKFVSTFVFLFLSASAFAQDKIFDKEDPDLIGVSAKIYVKNASGENQLILDSLKSYKDGDIQRIYADGLISFDLTYKHKYDADGKIAERKEFNEGVPTRMMVYTYNADGSWEMNGYQMDEDENRAQDPGYTEKYDKAGKILRMEFKNDAYRAVRVFSYDGIGQLLKMEETPDGASKPIVVENYKYNAKGELAAKEVLVGDVLRERTSYNDKGEKTEVERYDGTGKILVSKNSFTYEYKEFGKGERKASETTTYFVVKNGKWVEQGATLVKFSYVYKKK